MKTLARQLSRELVVIERIREDLLQCLESLELAASQKRPLRLAYFISRLKAGAKDYFQAEQAALNYLGKTEAAADRRKQEAFQAYLATLQESAMQQELSVKFVSELRHWGIMNFRIALPECPPESVIGTPWLPLAQLGNIALARQ